MDQLGQVFRLRFWHGRTICGKQLLRRGLIGPWGGLDWRSGGKMVRDRACKTPASEETARVVNGMRQRRVLICATGHEGHILKIRPALVFSSKDAKLFLATLEEVLTAL
jgi:hypothetical protein